MDTTLSMPNIFCILVVEIELLSLPCDAADSSVSRMGCDSSILFLYVFTCTLHARSPSDKQLSFGGPLHSSDEKRVVLEVR